MPSSSVAATNMFFGAGGLITLGYSGVVRAPLQYMSASNGSLAILFGGGCGCVLVAVPRKVLAGRFRAVLTTVNVVVVGVATIVKLPL